MTRLLFVSNLFPDKTEPYRGLDNATVLHHLRCEFEVRVIALRPTVFPFVKAKRVPREQDTLFAPQYVSASYVPKMGSALNHRLMAFALSKSMRKLRTDFPFEVVLVSWIYPDSCAVSRIARKMSFPFVAIAQGSDVHQYLQMPVRRKIIRASLQTASAVITRSARLARLLGDAGVAVEKLHPIYNGVDLELFRPGDQLAARVKFKLPSESKIILFVGNFYEVKNPSLLVRSHAELCRKEPNIRFDLVMIGGGPLESELLALANAEGFGEHVHFLGRRSSTEIAESMRAADVLCLTSENEGVPNVILEAFASGLRVVASDVGGIREVLNREVLGRTVERGNLPELVAALAQILFTTPDREAIRQHAHQFSWEGAAAAYAKLLKACA